MSILFFPGTKLPFRAKAASAARWADYDVLAVATSLLPPPPVGCSYSLSFAPWTQGQGDDVGSLQESEADSLDRRLWR